MSNMVYLMTSLPSLTFGQVPPISMDEFKDDAKKQLSKRHYKVLESVDIQKLKTNSGKKNIALLLKEVQKDLSEAREAKAENRQAKLGRLPKNVFVGNPLEREKKIMQWQWDELTDIEAGKTFSLTEVLVYKLKLQILDRMNSFDDEKGTQVIESVVNPAKNKEGK